MLPPCMQETDIASKLDSPDIDMTMKQSPQVIEHEI